MYWKKDSASVLLLILLSLSLRMLPVVVCSSPLSKYVYSPDAQS